MRAVRQVDLASRVQTGWREYTFFGGQMLAEKDQSGAWTNYIYANGKKIAKLDAAGTRYYLDDHLGTTQIELDSNGAVTWQGQFAPFGQEVDSQSTTMRFKFTGKERDAEIGLDYFSTRYYGSTMGRFTSPDSLLVNPLRLINPQRWNMYAYVINNPLTLTDPDGRDAIAVNFPADVHGLGHMGIISLHSDGSATYSRFGPQHPGSPVDVGQVRTDTNLPKVQFDSKGQPTDASLHDLTQAVSKFEDYTGTVNMAYFKTTEAETTALDQYIKAAQAASDAGKLSYVGPFSTCVTYCAVGMHRAGVNWRAAFNLSPIPNIWAANLADYADKNYTEK